MINLQRINITLKYVIENKNKDDFYEKIWNLSSDI